MTKLRYEVTWRCEDGSVAKVLYTSATTPNRAIDNTRYRIHGFGYEPNDLVPSAVCIPQRTLTQIQTSFWVRDEK